MRKRGIDSTREILGYKDVNVEQAEEIIYDMTAWRGFVRELA